MTSCMIVKRKKEIALSVRNIKSQMQTGYLGLSEINH